MREHEYRLREKRIKGRFAVCPSIPYRYGKTVPKVQGLVAENSAYACQSLIGTVQPLLIKDIKMEKRYSVNPS